MVKSDVADMKNVGIGRAAGTITAAAFLRNAIENTPWVHMDIAGVAYKGSGKEKGASGRPVAALVDYVLSNE